jgi:hypothetical protein
MESNPVYVSVSSLPDDVWTLLRDVNFNKSSIAVKSAETYRFHTPYGDGYQTFAGGRNLHETRRADVDEQEHKIPMNGAVISGQRGGAGPVSATLFVHPSNMPRYLPAGEMVSEAEARILVMYRSYTSAYRKENLKVKDEPVIVGLVARGLLKRNKAGATSITEAGKNAISGART